MFIIDVVVNNFFKAAVGIGGRLCILCVYFIIFVEFMIKIVMFLFFDRVFKIFVI